MNTERPSFEALANACGFQVVELSEQDFDRIEAAAKAVGLPICVYFERELKKFVNHRLNRFE